MSKKVEGSIQVLTWDENITLKNVEQFRQEMKELTMGSGEQLILNIANMNYINSAGLGIITDSVMLARKLQKELVIAEIQPAVHEIFSIVKFSSFMKVFQFEKEAIEYFMVNKHEKKHS